MKDLDGNVALVTGASQGIGEAIVLRLAAEGCRVVAASRRLEVCEEVAARAEEAGVEAMAVALDVTDADAAGAAVEAVLDRFGQVDFLVNNAGITRDDLLVRMSPDDWNAVLDTDLSGVYRCTKAVLRSMLRRRRGRIVTISSVVGLLGNPGQTAYAAAKAGTLGFTKALAREVSSRDITVNAVAPGYIDTEMTEALPDSARDQLMAQIPLGRLGSAEDVAGVVAFLLSEDAAYITGQVLSVDGGMHM